MTYSELIDLNNSVAMNANELEILYSAKEYKTRLVEYIKSAKNRIYITALYLQDDEAGREILDALYHAKQVSPELDIKIFVDAHRARRGLIGAKDQEGNRAFYLNKAKECVDKVDDKLKEAIMERKTEMKEERKAKKIPLRLKLSESKKKNMVRSKTPKAKKA